MLYQVSLSLPIHTSPPRFQSSLSSCQNFSKNHPRKSGKLPPPADSCPVLNAIKGYLDLIRVEALGVRLTSVPEGCPAGKPVRPGTESSILTVAPLHARCRALVSVNHQNFMCMHTHSLRIVHLFRW